MQKNKSTAQSIITPEVYGVDAFCEAHSISRALFYQLLKSGKGPNIIKLGRRTLISKDAAAAWRSSLETERVA